MTVEKDSRRSSFRKQLTTTVTIGILALAIVTSLTTAWITSANVYDQMVEDGKHVTKTVSKASVLALLYNSGENAEDAVNAALGFPSISHVALVTLDNDLLLSKGSYPGNLPTIRVDTNDAELRSETANEWIFTSPVFSQEPIVSDESAILFQEEFKQELLGSVTVIKSKDKLKQTVTATIINNLGIAIVMATLLLFIVRRNLSRLTRPLSELSQVMGHAEQGDTAAYAKLTGPREVHNIGRAFNKMMEALAERDAQLRRHNELLEYEVAQRTEELVYARDMAIQSNTNKSNFLSSVSHELRTPLQSIIGYSDLILETLPDDDHLDEVRHDIETIIQNANHLLNMINSVLDMSKLESGRMNLQLSNTDLNYVIKGVLETASPLLLNNNNKMESKIELEENTIVIDEAKLRQAILNLVSNAIKFTENGLIRLEAIQTPEKLRITVADNGIGMNDDQIEHIFDPFYQIEGGITRRFQGTGLGLAITHQFCKLMGGNIEVSSKINQGSTFTVMIPLPIKEAGNSVDE